MGRFHDELVQSRREGTALPQREQRGEAAPPPASEPITFAPVDPSSGIPVVCSRCGAVVAAEGAEIHAAWHRETGV